MSLPFRKTGAVARRLSTSKIPKDCLLGAARRKTLICCLSTQISASSVARARIRSTSVQKISQKNRSSLGSISRFVSARQLDLIYDRDNRDAANGDGPAIRKNAPG